MNTEQERAAFEAWYDKQVDGRIQPFDVWIAAANQARGELDALVAELRRLVAVEDAAPAAPTAGQEAAMQKLVDVSEDLGLYDDPPIASGYGPKLMTQVSGYGTPVETTVMHVTQHQEPAQQPLTDERLRQMHHEDEFGLFCDYDDFEQSARAIEQAHGIGLKND